MASAPPPVPPPQPPSLPLPPLRGPWQWLRVQAAPRDQLVLALGVAAALASGMYTTQVGVAISAALGAFATTPVDAAAVSTAVHDLQWLAFALLLTETLASLACTRVAAQFTSAFGANTRRRLQAPDGASGGGEGRSARAEPKIQQMEDAIRYRAAPALLACARNVALLGTAVALALSRCEDTLNVGFIVFGMVMFGGLATLQALTMAIPNPTSHINRRFAKYELAEMRAIAAHSAQDMVSAAHCERTQTSEDYDSLGMILVCGPSAMSLGSIWIPVPLVLVLWADIATQRTAVAPREAFEATSGALLASVALLLLMHHWRTIQQTKELVDKASEREAADIDTNQVTQDAPTGPREVPTVRTVFKLLQLDRRLMFASVVVAVAAGAAITRLTSFTASTVVTMVAEHALCGTANNTSTAEPHLVCREALHSLVRPRLTFLFKGAAGVAVCSFLSFWLFRILGAKVFRRVLSLHVEGICHQSVRQFESPGNGADAFYVAHESLPSDASSVCRRPGVLLVGISTTLSALAVFFSSGNWAITGPMLFLGTLDAGIGWTNYKQRRSVASFLDPLHGPMVGSAAFAKTMIPAVAFSYGMQLLTHGEVPSLGDIVVPLAALALALAAATLGISQAHAFCADWQRAVDACAVITELRAHAVQSTSSEELHRPKPHGKFEFQSVSFQDPMHKNASPLKQVSLTIHAGETVVFCGPPGGGHEHIVALLEKFYEPTSGDVLMDGENLKDVDTVWLRGQIGLVEANPILFEGSIADNITVGCGRDTTPEEIEDAAKLAQAHDRLVADLADVYQSKVTPAETYHDLFGIRTRHPWADRRMLSVYIKDGSAAPMDLHHRIALARVFLKDPSILILNEPTKALDVERPKVVRQGVDKLLASKKRTTIIIGHETPAVRTTDRIYVLKDGGIAEHGTHEELIARDGGLYRSLVE